MHTVNGDRIFHVDLVHPVEPVPDFGEVVPGGAVSLSWTNYAATAGDGDVWVDVWFGTTSGALTRVSGQSNMVGFGRLNGDRPGTLEYMTKTENKFPNNVEIVTVTLTTTPNGRRLFAQVRATE